MAETTVFVSRATDYDLFIGNLDIGDLPVERQDTLIRAVLDALADFRKLVQEWNVRKAQAEGLWSIVVMVGTALESQRAIQKFDCRSADDNRKIVDALAGTALWQRLEEAFPPFYDSPERSSYDWTELEKVDEGFFTSVAGEPIHKVQAKLYGLLARRKVDGHYDTRMPHDKLSQLWGEGKIAIHVDNALAAVASARGIVKSWAGTLGLAGMASLIAVPVVSLVWSIWWGLATLTLAVVLFKKSKSALRSAVVRTALADQEKYRWLASRGAVWVRWLD